MPGTKNRILMFLAIALIAQGALSSAWATSRCAAMKDCAPQVSPPCPMGDHASPCEGMFGDCGQSPASKLRCGDGCAREFSRVPALLSMAPDAPLASAVGVPIVLAADASRTSIPSGAALAPSSRGRPALWLTTHSLLI